MLKNKKLEEISKIYSEKVDGLINTQKIYEKKLRLARAAFAILAVASMYPLYVIANPQEGVMNQWVNLLLPTPLLAVIPVSILFAIQWRETRKMKSAINTKILELEDEEQDAKKNV